MNRLETKQIITMFGFLVGLIVVISITRYTILGGASQITLLPAPPLAGVIAPSLANLAAGNSLPIEGVDYSIDSVQYFDNKTYAVLSVSALKLRGDISIIVLQRLAGNYRVILGPGTAFARSDVQGLPDNVTQYLQTKVLIYEPDN